MNKHWAFVIDGTRSVLLANSNEGCEALSLQDRYIIISCDGAYQWTSVHLIPTPPPDQEVVTSKSEPEGLPMQVFDVLARRFGTLEAEKIVEQIYADMKMEAR